MERGHHPQVTRLTQLVDGSDERLALRGDVLHPAEMQGLADPPQARAHRQLAPTAGEIEDLAGEREPLGDVIRIRQAMDPGHERVGERRGVPRGPSDLHRLAAERVDAGRRGRPAELRREAGHDARTQGGISCVQRLQGLFQDPDERLVGATVLRPPRADVAQAGRRAGEHRGRTDPPRQRRGAPERLGRRLTAPGAVLRLAQGEEQGTLAGGIAGQAELGETQSAPELVGRLLVAEDLHRLATGLLRVHHRLVLATCR